MAIAALPHDRAAAVERLLRETDLSMRAIAAETGVSAKTISTWNGRLGLRRPGARRAGALAPASWPAARRDAVARLYQTEGVDLGDLAVAMGAPRPTAGALFRACGLTGRPVRAGRRRPPPGPLPAPVAAEGPALRQALRAHVARQIAGFDAALNDAGAALPDSARVLRDLGGLRRLMADLDAADRAEAGHGWNRHAGARDGHADAQGNPGDAPPVDTLPALRAAIAQRCAAGAGADEPDPGCDAGPAAAQP